MPYWNQGQKGDKGDKGDTGPSTIGSPNALAPSLATAYQASDPTRAAVVTINLSSAAGLSLTSGETHTADVLIGSTNAVAGGTGTVAGKYNNSLTGVLGVGLGVNVASANPIVFTLPIGWYYAVRQTSGTVSIVSAFDQAIG